jgi:hypothetical protein
MLSTQQLGSVNNSLLTPPPRPPHHQQLHLPSSYQVPSDRPPALTCSTLPNCLAAMQPSPGPLSAQQLLHSCCLLPLPLSELLCPGPSFCPPTPTQLLPPAQALSPAVLCTAPHSTPVRSLQGSLHRSRAQTHAQTRTHCCLHGQQITHTAAAMLSRETAVIDTDAAAACNAVCCAAIYAEAAATSSCARAVRRAPALLPL